MNKKYDYPEVVVGVFIQNSNGEFLFVESYSWNGVLTIPGGHIEMGETAIEAVKREVKEETNLDITDIKFLRFVEAIFDPAFSTSRHLLGLHFTCKATSNEILLNEEHKSFRWFSPQEVLDSFIINERNKGSFKLIKRNAN